mmetsp:Transcript_2757/g.6934  ORF Transcript_2757/g.6934 Transcript_2757/m.6934 type:complete len:215 (-) Transcript_2757:376-1020(-)
MCHLHLHANAHVHVRRVRGHAQSTRSPRARCAACAFACRSLAAIGSPARASSHSRWGSRSGTVTSLTKTGRSLTCSVTLLWPQRSSPSISSRSATNSSPQLSSTINTSPDRAPSSAAHSAAVSSARTMLSAEPIASPPLAFSGETRTAPAETLRSARLPHRLVITSAARSSVASSFASSIFSNAPSAALSDASFWLANGSAEPVAGSVSSRMRL